MEKSKWDIRLIEAVKDKKIEAVKECLENGANPNAKDYDGHTALSWAIAIQPNLDIVKALVEKGADVNAKSDKRENVSSMTPLSHSLYENSIEIAKYLIDNGADVTAKDDDGLTPLHWICNKSKEYGNNNMSYHIAINKNIETYEFAKMLIDKGADVNAEHEYFKETPLHWATSKISFSYNPQIIQLLIDNGANVNAKDKNGRTPLMNASERLNLELAKTLLKNGADINAKRDDGATALNIANSVIVLKKNSTEDKEMVDFLLKNGAEFGKTLESERIKERTIKKHKKEKSKNNYEMGGI